MDLFLDDIKSRFKLDFIDKIIISVVFIIGAILCPFYVFASETEDVELGTLSNVRVNNDGVLASGSLTLAYFEIEPGYIYHITNTAQNGRALWYSTGIDLGSQCSQSIPLNSGDTYDVYRSGGYIYLLGSSGPVSYTVTREPFGMSNVITNLSNLVNTDNIYNIFISIIPYITVIVVCAIGFYIIRKLVISLSKGKSRI